jgi:hypothetical protein
MRNSYPPGIQSQPSGDRDDIGDKSVHFFTQAFQSSNKYVVVYKTNYGQTPGLSAQLNPPFIQTGTSTNITGTLAYPNGIPIGNANVTLQYSLDKANWTTFGKAKVDSSGIYVYVNWTPPASTSTLYVRAYWPGDPARKLGFAISPYQPLTQR